MDPRSLREMVVRYLHYVRDLSVPRWRRLAGLLAVLYWLSPLDVLPDVLPLVGWLDDVGVLSAAALFTLRELKRYRPPPRTLSEAEPVLRRVA